MKISVHPPAACMVPSSSATDSSVRVLVVPTAMTLPPRFFSIIDDISGFLSDLIILRMHMVLCHILHLNRTECAQAHMKGHTGDADAFGFNGRQKFRCKMQSGCGCSGTAFMFGIDRLVTVLS